MTDVIEVEDAGAARSALTSGVASVLLTLLHLTPWVGQFVFYGSIVIGVSAVVFGIIALRKHQPKSMAVTGIILGGVASLFCISTFVFGLIFTGALPL